MGIRTVRTPRPRGGWRTGRRLAVLVLAAIAVTVSTLASATGAQAAPPSGPHAPTAGSAFAQNIINYSSNKCLQPQSASPNAIVVQRTCSSTNYLQRWFISDLGDGYSFLVNQGSGLCLDLQANSEAEVGNGTLVQVFYCSAAYTSEHWAFSSGSRANHYQIFNKVKGICADVRNRSSADGAVLQVWSCKYYETAQEFRFVSA